MLFASAPAAAAQGAAVNSVQFSPDGTRLVSANMDNEIVIWDVETGERQITFPALEDYVVFVAWSPDAKTLASASYDNRIRLWDVATATVRDTLVGHAGVPFYAHFSPDGRLLSTAAEGGEVFVWDVDAAQLKQLFAPPGDIATSARFAPDGASVLIVGRGGSMGRWNVKDDEVASYQVGGATLTTGRFANAGANVAGGGSQGIIRVFDAVTGSILETYDHGVYSNSFTLTDQLLASAGGDGTLKVWSRQDGSELYTRAAHRRIAFFVEVSPDGQTLATVGQDTRIRLWDAATGRLLRTIDGR